MAILHFLILLFAIAYVVIGILDFVLFHTINRGRQLDFYQKLIMSIIPLLNIIVLLAILWEVYNDYGRYNIVVTEIDKFLDNE